MKEDYKELVEYLDGKFSKIGEDFTELKVYKADKKDIELLKESFNDLQTSVDAYAGKADKFFEELVMLSNQVKRHEKWLQQIADKLGIRLEY